MKNEEPRTSSEATSFHLARVTIPSKNRNPMRVPTVYFLLSTSYRLLPTHHEHHFEVRGLRVEGKAFSVLECKACRCKFRIVAGQCHRIAGNINQAVYGTLDNRFERFLREPCARRIHNKRCRHIHHVFYEPVFRRGRNIFYNRPIAILCGFFYRQVYFCVLEAALFALHGRHAFEAFHKECCKKSDTAKQVYQPFVARLATGKAFIYSLPDGFDKFRQQSQVALEEYGRIGFYFLPANFNNAHGVFPKFLGRHSTIIVTDFTLAVIEDIDIRIRGKARELFLHRNVVQKLIQGRRQDRAFFHPDKVVRFLFAETKFLRNPRKHNTGTVAVPPRVPRVYFEIFRKFRMGKAPEVFAFHLFQVRSLFFTRQVLQAATATAPVHGALRLYSVWIRLQNFNSTATSKILLLERKLHLAKFTGECAFYKANTAVRQAGKSIITPFYTFLPHLHTLVEALGTVCVVTNHLTVHNGIPTSFANDLMREYATIRATLARIISDDSGESADTAGIDLRLRVRRHNLAPHTLGEALFRIQFNK